MSFFVRDVHPVVWFARFRSNDAAVESQDRSFTYGAPVSREAYPCANGLLGMSVFFLLLLLFMLPKSCAIEVNLLVSADHLCGSSSNLVSKKVISMISSKNLRLENRNSEGWINLGLVLNDYVCVSDVGDVAISNAVC